MKFFDAVKKENIGKTYKIFIDGVNKGVWELKNEFSTEEFDFYKDGESLTEIYFSSKIARMEFEEVIDWSKVPVDTLIEVSDDGKAFLKRYFAKYESGMIFSWGDGRSSETAYSENDVVKWEIANIISI